jgi:hypothetical protein
VEMYPKNHLRERTDPQAASSAPLCFGYVGDRPLPQAVLICSVLNALVGYVGDRPLPQAVPTYFDVPRRGNPAIALKIGPARIRK